MRITDEIFENIIDQNPPLIRMITNHGTHNYTLNKLINKDDAGQSIISDDELQQIFKNADFKTEYRK